MAPNGAAAKAPANAKQSVPANQTLYLTNLNDKVRKDELRRALYCLFSTYGPVLDVVALKTMKMRGQAHIVFRDIQTSSQAMRSLQGFDLFGREMIIQYAKGKSATISKLDGTADIPQTRTDSAPAKTEAQSIFNTPSQIPQAAAQKSAGLKPNGVDEEDGGKSPGGVKRPREEDSEEEDAPMDEDDDAMDESDDD